MEKVIVFIVGIYLVIMAVIDRRTKKIPVIPGIVCMAMVALAQVVDGREGKCWIPGLLVGIFMYAVSRISRTKADVTVDVTFSTVVDRYSVVIYLQKKVNGQWVNDSTNEEYVFSVCLF